MDFTATLSRRMVVTNDEVLTEFLTFCASDEMLRGVAGRAVNDLLNNPDIRVIAQSRSSFVEGLALYNFWRVWRANRERSFRWKT